VFGLLNLLYEGICLILFVGVFLTGSVLGGTLLLFLYEVFVIGGLPVLFLSPITSYAPRQIMKIIFILPLRWSPAYNGELSEAIKARGHERYTSAILSEVEHVLRWLNCIVCYYVPIIII